MIDRGIGIAGIGLGILFGALQYFEVDIPVWLVLVGVGMGIFMLGMSAGLLWLGEGRKKQKDLRADTAILRLHVYGDHRTPERLEDRNIFRWYYLSHIVGLKHEDGNETELVLPTLFVTFEPPVRITTLKVRSPDMQLPRYEVKEFNQRFAIVVFSEALKEGTLEVRVEQ